MNEETALQNQESPGYPDYLKDKEWKPTALDSRDVIFPSLIIAQTNSKAVLRGGEGFISGLEPGQYYNSESREIFGDLIRVIISHRFRVYQVFKQAGTNLEWLETLPAAVYEALPEVVSEPGVGSRSPMYPNCVIKETKRYALLVDGRPDLNLIFLNVKAGGLAQARQLDTRVYGVERMGSNPVPAQSVIWEIGVKLISSKTVNASSYQIDGAAQRVGVATKEQFDQAILYRDLLVESESNAVHPRTADDKEY